MSSFSYSWMYVVRYLVIYLFSDFFLYVVRVLFMYVFM